MSPPGEMGRLGLSRRAQAGDAIPISARLMALADVYDALISRRVYKPALRHDKAVEHDPRGARQAFRSRRSRTRSCEIEDEFRAIAARYADPDDDRATRD